MRIRIEFDEVVRRSVVVNCSDLHVARGLWEDGPDHIRENWLAESVEIDAGPDLDSASFTAEEG